MAKKLAPLAHVGNLKTSSKLQFKELGYRVIVGEFEFALGRDRHLGNGLCYCSVDEYPWKDFPCDDIWQIGHGGVALTWSGVEKKTGDGGLLV